MKPPVEAPTSRQTRPAGSIAERVERRGQLLAAARHERRGSSDARCGVAGSTRSPGLRSSRAPSPAPTRTWPASSSACACERGRRPGRDRPAAGRAGSRLGCGRRLRRCGPRAARPRDGVSPSVVDRLADLGRRCRPRRCAGPRRRSADRAVIDELVAPGCRCSRTGSSRRAASARPASASASSTAEPKPPADDALLERHDQLLAARLLEDQLAIERLGVARVDDADRPALRGQRARRPPRRA